LFQIELADDVAVRQPVTGNHLLHQGGEAAGDFAERMGSRRAR
jgi:hypothetical protein